MANAKIGAVVRYCGHAGTFVADIFEVGEVNVVKTDPVTNETLDRNKYAYDTATHELTDFPSRGCWCPERGIFVVPKAQVTELCKK